MNLVQIGKFIAELRKERGLTQEEFGEKMSVTNKTVSRWETGMYLPPAEALLSMSEIFEVSINEILSGKRLEKEAYRAAAEENLRQAVQESRFSLKEKVDFYKKKWLREHIAGMCCWSISIVGVFIAGVVWGKPLFVAGAILLFLLGHIWRNNTMMAYVERNTYDGIGKE